jgi:hypothetical protein
MVMITKIPPVLPAADYCCLRLRLAVKMSLWRATLMVPVFSGCAAGGRIA